MGRRSRGEANTAVEITGAGPDIDTERAEAIDDDRLVTSFQAGDTIAFEAIYRRYLDRVFAYLKILLNDVHEAEDATQQVFTRAFEALPRYEHRGHAFQAWLFTIVRNTARTILTQRHRLEPTPAEDLENHSEAGRSTDLDALDWLRDADLLLFIERLPLVQRQILLLRFMLDLAPDKVAQVLNRTPVDIRVHQHRALANLRKRLISIGHPAASRHQARTRAPIRQSTVLRSRRYSL